MTDSAKKILWVFSSFEIGAPQRRYAELISRLGGYEHVICAVDGRREAESLIAPSATWRAIAAPRGRKRGLSISRLWTSRKLLASEHPHLLVTVGLDAIDMLAVNRGPGSAPHLHFQDPIGPEEALGDAEAVDWTRRRAFAGRDRLFVADDPEIERLLIEKWGAPAEKIRHLPWGVDLERVHPTPRAADRRTTIFGSLAPLATGKRHDRLLRVIATLRERGRAVGARLVGQGPEKARLEALAERLGLEDAVIFVDRDGLDPTVAAEETALMDVYADLADVSRCGAECALAMAAGLPIVATKTGPTANCASAANRIFIRPLEDESGIAAAAELLASDPQLCAEIGTANREKAEIDFDANAMMEASAALFGEALGVHGRLMLPKPEAAPPRRPQARELEKRTPERRAPTPRAPAAAAPTPILPQPTALPDTAPKPNGLKPNALKPNALTPNGPKPQTPTPQEPQAKTPPLLAAAASVPAEPESTPLRALLPSTRDAAPAVEPAPAAPTERQAEHANGAHAAASVEETALHPTELSPSVLQPTALKPTALKPTPLTPSALTPTALQPRVTPPAPRRRRGRNGEAKAADASALALSPGAAMAAALAQDQAADGSESAQRAKERGAA